MASVDLRKECNRMVFEAVNEISIFKFHLVKNTFSQIEVLTSLVQYNEKGETPLEIAMKGENVSLIDELVKFLRQCDCEVAKCRVMSEAIDKLLCRQIPILELIDYLINIDYDVLKFGMLDNTKWVEIIAQVVFKSTLLSRSDKITALELIGASLRYYSGEQKLLMFRYWREAMKLRYFPADGEPLLPKIPYLGVASVASSVVFGPTVEVMTMEELDLLEGYFDPNLADLDVEVPLRCIALLERQSLHVIRRISSQANHGLPHWLYLESLYQYGSGKIDVEESERDYGNFDLFYNDSGADNKLIINTFLLIMEQMSELDPKLLPRKSFDIFIKTLAFASRLLATLTKEPPGSRGKEDLSYANLLAITKFIGTIANYFPNPAMISTVTFHDKGYSDFAEIVSDLILVMEYISPHLNNLEKQQLEEHFTNYIQNHFLDRKATVLHARLRVLRRRRFRFRTIDLLKLKPIKLLLELGANPNAIDEDGHTPLHILAGLEIRYLDIKMMIVSTLQHYRSRSLGLRVFLGLVDIDGDSYEYMPVFQALVHAGAHLDIAADDGETVIDILKKNRNVRDVERSVEDETYFSSLIATVFPLSCYCARVIRQNGINEDRLPLHLQEFVSRHSAKGSVHLRQRRAY